MRFSGAGATPVSAGLLATCGIAAGNNAGDCQRAGGELVAGRVLNGTAADDTAGAGNCGRLAGTVIV
jgi:hypothetical protein